MRFRAIISIGLAVAFPVGSMVGIQSGNFNLGWLSFPDVLISLALLHGLKSDTEHWIFLGGFTLTLALTLMNPELGALFPSLIFLLISRYFQRSLTPPQKPLITQMARHVRGQDAPFSQAALSYTLGLTRAWWLFFVFLGLIQVLLVIFTQSNWAWMMGNTLAPALIFLFLVLEPVYRRHRLPNEPQHSLRHFFSRLSEADWKRME
ncbi:MAG: hypothetical protein RLZ25_1450 [Pseudomonadota bacterium]